MRITLTILAFIFIQQAYTQGFETLCNDGLRSLRKKEYSNAINNFERAVMISNSEEVLCLLLQQRNQHCLSLHRLLLHLFRLRKAIRKH